MADFSFRGQRSLALRVWHWLNALVLAALVTTVVLRDQLVDVREHVGLIQQKLATLGVTISDEQAKAIARLYLERLWGWHVNLGLVLAGLVLLRLVAGVRAQPGTSLVAKIRRALPAVKTDKLAAKFLLVKLSHVVFYALLLTLVGTGLVLAYSKGLGVGKDLHEALAEVHEFSMYAALAFVALHLVGVVSAEKTTDPGIVSEMIHGG